MSKTDEFTNGIIELIFKTFMVEGSDGQRAVMVQGDVVVDVMMTFIATLSADSEATASPTKTRALCDEIARKIRLRIAEAKRQGSPFQTIQPGRA